MCQTSICTCHHDFSKVNVACCRKHIYAIHSSKHIWSSCNFSLIIFKYLLHDLICILIIISILWTMIFYQIQDSLMTDEIIIKRCHQLIHREVFLIIYIIFYSSKAVCNRSDSNTLQIFCIVSCTAGIIILALCDTIICKNR